MTTLEALLRRIRPDRVRKVSTALALAALALSLTFLTMRGTSARSDHPRVDPPPTPTKTPRALRSGQTTTPLKGPGLVGTFAFDRSAIVEGRATTVSAELRLQAKAKENRRRDQPIALAIVVDTSGSMMGEKILDTQRSVRALLESMREEDRVAIVAYSGAARTLQELAPVRTVRDRTDQIVASLVAAGGTNIPAGLEAGSRALVEAPSSWVRRMVLLSDGRDGSGVSIESLCASIRDRATSGLTLSSIGIGTDYSEHYMSSVADAGNGNYVFLAHGSSLDAFLRRELEEATATEIDRAIAELELPAGWQLEATYGAEGRQIGSRVVIPLGAIRSSADRRAVLRFKVHTGADGRGAAPTLKLDYRTTHDDEPHHLAKTLDDLEVVATTGLSDASRDIAVFGVTEAAHLEKQQAIAADAWRQGDIAGASKRSNETYQAAKSLYDAVGGPALGAVTRSLEKEAAVMAAPSSPAAEEAVRSAGAARRARARSASEWP